jgi:predicted DNA-binding transcriptional regulator AlpA
VIPRLLRYKDLKALGVVANWTTLLRWIDAGHFPPGIKIGPHSRAWTDTSIAEWLAERERAA